MIVAAASVFASTPAQATYWNLYNLEGTSDNISHYATYATLSDMTRDINRIETYIIDKPSSQNLVGTGADGSTYWNLFNLEGTSDNISHYATYATLSDMMRDINRIETYIIDKPSSQNLIGTGADGSTYWNLFNLEGTSDNISHYTTYATLSDMMRDNNRIETYIIDKPSSQNLVGTGADIRSVAAVPEPSTWAMLILGFMMTGMTIRRQRRTAAVAPRQAISGDKTAVLR